MTRRIVGNPEVLEWFTRPSGEDHTFNMIPDLSRVECPTLVMGGEEDPMTPIECQRHRIRLATALGSLRALPRLRHAVVPDAPEQALAKIREFIVR